MAPLRWGIYSAGKISHDFVVGLKALPETDHQVVAVAARSEESAEKFAKTHSITRHYGSYSQLAEDAEIDVVYIGTIHPHHVKGVLMMFEAGKPVLCEKPLTCCVADTRALIKAAKEKGVFLMEATWSRFFPAMVELRKQISEGAIGEVKYISANFGVNIVSVSRISMIEQGGGAVLDIGVYPISLATMIFGEEPESVQSSGWLMPTGVDEFAAITLKYSGQRIAQLMCCASMEAPNDAVIIGTKGTIRLPHHFWSPSTLSLPNGEVKEFPLPTPYLPTNFTNSAGLCYEAEAVRQCINNGQKESEIMPLSHTQIAANIMETVMKQLGRPNMNL